MWDYEALRTDAKGCGRPIQVHATEMVAPETFIFPLQEAQNEKLVLFRPTADLKALESREALPFENCSPRQNLELGEQLGDSAWRLSLGKLLVARVVTE